MNLLNMVRKYFSDAIIIAELELRKIRHDQTQVWVRVVQPALWLAIYGLTMTKISALSAYIPKDITYLQFMNLPCSWPYFSVSMLFGKGTWDY